MNPGAANAKPSRIEEGDESQGDVSPRVTTGSIPYSVSAVGIVDPAPISQQVSSVVAVARHRVGASHAADRLGLLCGSAGSSFLPFSALL